MKGLLSIIVWVIMLLALVTVAAGRDVFGTTNSTSPQLVTASNQVKGRVSQRNSSCTLEATASKTKGRIDLSWSCSSKLRGAFLVERSQDNNYWEKVSSCTTAVSQSSSYSCSDTRLTSGASYSYRLCLVASTKTTKCGANGQLSSASTNAR